MAYYAIYVRSGTERLVANHINLNCQKQQRTEITKIIVPIKTTMEVAAGNKITQKIKPKIDSYIFISVKEENENEYNKLNGSIYQFLKNSSPHIRQILPHSLQKTECDAFLDSDKTSEVEIKIAISPQENIHDPLNLIEKLKKIRNNYKNIIHLKKVYAKYIQSVLWVKGRKVNFQFDNNYITVTSDSWTMMNLFSNSSMTIIDLIKDPFRTLQKVVKSYGKQVNDSC